MATLLILLASISADARFTDGGYRAEESITNAEAKTFAELAKLACTPDNAPALAKYSITGKPDYRLKFSQRMWDAFQRYAGPVNVQFPRCHCGRTYDGTQKWDYRYADNGRPADALTNDELRQFKAACYTLLKAPDAESRKHAMQHLVITATADDVKPMLAMLKSRDDSTPRGLICIALGRVSDPSAIPAIAKELAGPEWERALAALEHYGTPEALAAIEGAKFYSDPLVGGMVNEVVKAMRARGIGRVAVD